MTGGELRKDAFAGGEPEKGSGGPVEVRHGDALEVLAELAAGSVDAIICDPPYCSGGGTEASRGAATHQGLRSSTVRSGSVAWFAGDNMTTAGLCWLLRGVAVQAARVLTAGGHLLVFADWRMVPMVAPAIESAGLRYRSQVVWDKGYIGCGAGFRPRHELVLHFTGRAPVFFAKNVGNVIAAPRVSPRARRHPCEKPAKLLADLVRLTVPPGGLVVDPFAGSGSLGEAAAALGRRALLIERDPALVERLRVAGQRDLDGAAA